MWFINLLILFIVVCIYLKVDLDLQDEEFIFIWYGRRTDIKRYNIKIRKFWKTF